MVDDNVEGAVAGSRVHFQIWKVWLGQKKKTATKYQKTQRWYILCMGAMLSGSMSGMS
jgi:phage gp37-like protein